MRSDWSDRSGWPHQGRNTARVSYADRKAVIGQLKPIYTTADEEAALVALASFADSPLGKKWPPW